MRTVYLGNVPDEVDTNDVMHKVYGGVIEEVHAHASLTASYVAMTKAIIVASAAATAHHTIITTVIAAAPTPANS